MRRFRFPFETLQKLRRRQREQDEQALGRALAERAREAGRLAQLAEEKAEADEAWRKALPVRGPVDAGLAASRKGYAAVVTQRMGQSAQALASADQAVAARRGELLAAWRREQVVLKLRERQQAEWAVVAGREEQAFLDEVGLRCHP